MRINIKHFLSKLILLCYQSFVNVQASKFHEIDGYLLVKKLFEEDMLIISLIKIYIQDKGFFFIHIKKNQPNIMNCIFIPFFQLFDILS